MIVPIGSGFLQQLIADHYDSRIRLLELNGQAIFPVQAPSGGIMCLSILYFYAGEIEGDDMGRAGPRKRAYGHTWGVELDPFMENTDTRVRAELWKFSEYLDAQGFQ